VHPIQKKKKVICVPHLFIIKLNNLCDENVLIWLGYEDSLGDHHIESRTTTIELSTTSLSEIL